MLARANEKALRVQASGREQVEEGTQGSHLLVACAHLLLRAASAHSLDQLDNETFTHSQHNALELPLAHAGR